MASPTFYAAGTVSVANAATAVTGVGTAWVGKVYPGDLFADPLQPMVPPQRVASVTDDTHLVLWAGWPGTAIAAGPYEVRITPDSARVQENTRRVLEALASAVNVGFAPPLGMTADDVQAAIEELAGRDALPTGGATGQLLAKQSGTDGDADWIDVFADLHALALVGTSAGPGSLSFAEDLDNGVNKITLQAAAALSGDFTVTLPSFTGTLVIGPTTTVDNALVRYDGVAGIIQASAVTIDDGGNVSGVGTLGASAAISMTFQSADTFSSGLRIYKRGTTGDANAAITNGTEIGYHSFYGWGGSAFGRGAYVIVKATENWSAVAQGSSYSILVTPNGSPSNARAVLVDQDQQVYFDKGARSLSGGIGYATGAGGTVTQATSKSTGVTLSKASGQVTMNAAALAANAEVTFTLTNTLIAADDILVFNHSLTAKYVVNAVCAAGSAAITVRNVTAGSLSQALVVKFALLKAAST